MMTDDYVDFPRALRIFMYVQHVTANLSSTTLKADDIADEERELKDGGCKSVIAQRIFGSAGKVG